MQVTWSKFWLRAPVTLALLMIIILIASCLPVLVLILFHSGSLDFAGGSVVHLNWAMLFGLATVPWAVSELAAWRSRKPWPLGSLLLFAATFVAVLGMTMMPAHGAGAAKGIVMVPWVSTVVAVIIALVPAGLYAWFVRVAK